MTESKGDLFMTKQGAYGHKDGRPPKPASRRPEEGRWNAAEWVAETDIVRHDFPYLSGLISESYRCWQEEAASTGTLPLGGSCALDHDGCWIAGDEAADAARNRYAELALASLASGAEEADCREEDRAIYAYVVVPLKTRTSGETFAFLGLKLSADLLASAGSALPLALGLHYRSIFYRLFEFGLIKDMAGTHVLEKREHDQKTILFQLVRRMHDNIGVDEILSEVIECMMELCPEARLELFISQDHRSRNPRVKPLPLRWETQDVRARAFKDGRATLQITTQEDGRIIELGLPLAGKQGIYGVFHLIMEHPELGETDIRFLSMVADTAGTAFENAKLHERANQLIRELRMSNELTQRLNQSLKLKDIFQCAFEELIDMFQADYCCILYRKEDCCGLEAVACNHPALVGETIEIGKGLGGIVYATGESVILSDYMDQVESSSRLMNLTGSQSLIATPLSVGGEIKGAIMLTHRNRDYFSYDNYRLLQAMAGQIGLAVGNAALHAEVRRLANRDSLTGLYARHYLDDEIHTRQSTDFCGSLIVVDIDQFKLVNDTYGHQQGDRILKTVSEIVRSSVRAGDIAARWGGEELAVYLPQLGIRQAARIAERIRERVQFETEPPVTVSCGIAEWSWTDEGVSVESLFYRADMALYEAKNGGRNRIVADRNRTERAGTHPMA